MLSRQEKLAYFQNSFPNSCNPPTPEEIHRVAGPAPPLLPSFLPFLLPSPATSAHNGYSAQLAVLAAVAIATHPPSSRCGSLPSNALWSSLVFGGLEHPGPGGKTWPWSVWLGTIQQAERQGRHAANLPVWSKLGLAWGKASAAIHSVSIHSCHMPHCTDAAYR